jgi:GT2 family glycosyltransferase
MPTGTQPQHQVGRSVCVVVLRLGSHALSTTLSDALRLVRTECSNVSVVVAENSDGKSYVELDEATIDQVIKFPFNVGYATAINATIKEAGSTASTILVMTDDVVLRTGSFATLIETCAASDIGIAAPTIHTGGEVWLGGTWHSKWGWARHRVRTTSEPTDNRLEVDTTWVDGSCLAIDKVAFDEIGGFDERTFLYGEDLILCLKMRSNNRRVVVVPRVQINQQSGMTKRSGAHGYLLVRNEILCSQLLNGRPSALGTIGSSLVRAGAQLFRALRSSSQRGHYLKQSLGMVWGILDASRGRFGPPPEKLARWANIPNIDRIS